MKKTRISEAVSAISDEYINEAVSYSGEKRNSSSSYIKTFIALAAVLVVAVGAAVSSVLRYSSDNNLFDDGGLSEGGGTDGKINVTAELQITGLDNVVTDEEASVYLDSVTESISETLKRSGVGINGELRITDKGYSHIKTGDSGNTMAVNWRDYLAYDGERIVALITLVKENKSGLTHHIAFGGPWYSEYAELLENHKGEQLVYVYIGDVEAIITPENEVVTAIGTDVSASLEENKDYYSFFRTPYNVYVP